MFGRNRKKRSDPGPPVGFLPPSSATVWLPEAPVSQGWQPDPDAYASSSGAAWAPRPPGPPPSPAPASAAAPSAVAPPPAYAAPAPAAAYPAPAPLSWTGRPDPAQETSFVAPDLDFVRLRNGVPHVEIATSEGECLVIGPSHPLFADFRAWGSEWAAPRGETTVLRVHLDAIRLPGIGLPPRGRVRRS